MTYNKNETYFGFYINTKTRYNSKNKCFETYRIHVNTYSLNKSGFLS